MKSIILAVAVLLAAPLAAQAQCFGHGSKSNPIQLSEEEVRAVLLSRLLSVEPEPLAAKQLTAKDVENAVLLMAAQDVGKADFRDRFCARLKQLITRLQLLHDRVCPPVQPPAPEPAPAKPPAPAPVAPPKDAPENKAP